MHNLANHDGQILLTMELKVGIYTLFCGELFDDQMLEEGDLETFFVEINASLGKAQQYTSFVKLFLLLCNAKPDSI